MALHEGVQLRHFKSRYADSAITDNSFTSIQAGALHKGVQLRHFKSRYADSAIDNSFTSIKAGAFHKGVQLRHFKSRYADSAIITTTNDKMMKHTIAQKHKIDDEHP